MPVPPGRFISPGLALRSAVGGALMGLANLVPGISGGTMLVATGIYTRFIDAVSDVTRLRLRMASLALLAVVVASAAVAVIGCAGLIAEGLTSFRWGMYSLFIGLTLGGAPLLWRMIRGSGSGPVPGAAWMGLAAGVLGMSALVVAQTLGAEGGGGRTNAFMLGVGGVAGASAMILPGVSGAYLLLLLGQYDTIVTAIKDAASAAADADVAGLLAPMRVIVPVGLGVVLGIAGVSNLLRFVLHRYEKATLGVLLGLLLAAPLGLYPFRHGVPPQPGDLFEGEVLTEVTAGEIEPKDWPQEFFRPGPGHIAGSAALVLGGFVVTLAIARLGRERESASA
ncbi:MAG: undecaprenyl phosphate translocase family protein [Phycisphaerales bacterium]